MDELKSDDKAAAKAVDDVQPKWDYTSREQTLFTGALVVGLNLLVVLALILDRTVPSAHAFFSGKPL